MAATPKAVLIDVDGTLIDSNDAHARSWVEALGRHGYPVFYERVRPLMGMGGDKLLAELTDLDEFNPAAKEVAKARREIMKRSLPGLRPTRGARALLLRLRERSLRLVVATSSSADDLRDLLRQAGVADLIDAAATASDAESSKPDPDIVEAAIRLTGARPSECIMLGDTPYDIAAAHAAGVGTIVFRCGGGWPDEELTGAIEIHDDPQALLEALDESALAGPA